MPPERLLGRNPALSRSSLNRSQTTILSGFTPACWSRSQIASTMATLVAPPLPARQFTFSPTVCPGCTTLRQASTALSQLK
jgi:hypothetical protein